MKFILTVDCIKIVWTEKKIWKMGKEKVLGHYEL